MYRRIVSKAMKLKDKDFAENLVKLLGAKQAKASLLEKVNNLSHPNINLNLSPYFGMIQAEYIREYGEMLLYIERAYREELSK